MSSDVIHLHRASGQALRDPGALQDLTRSVALCGIADHESAQDNPGLLWYFVELWKDGVDVPIDASQIRDPAYEHVT